MLAMTTAPILRRKSQVDFCSGACHSARHCCPHLPHDEHGDVLHDSLNRCEIVLRKAGPLIAAKEPSPHCGQTRVDPNAYEPTHSGRDGASEAKDTMLCSRPHKRVVAWIQRSATGGNDDVSLPLA